MVSILLVSGDVSELTQLIRRLMQTNPSWHVQSCPNSTAAIGLLQRFSFDYVVVDLELVGVTGDILLRYTSQEYPQATRILIAGDSDRGLVLRSLGVAHRLLSKPTAPEALVATIKQAEELKTQLANPALRERLLGFGQLPCLPKTYMQIVDVLSQEDFPQSSLLAVITQDTTVTAQILRVANSAFFAARGEISNLADAITILGTNTIRTVVLAAETFSIVKSELHRSFELDRLWAHSFEVGTCASAIAASRPETSHLKDDALTAGVLHDMGKLILIHRIPEDYKEVLRVEEKEALPRFVAEQRVLGITHQEIGGYMLRLWMLPDNIVEAVANHHQPLHSAAQKTSPLTFVAAANIIVRQGREASSQFPDAAELMEHLSRVGLRNEFSHWREQHLQRAEAED